MEGIVKHEKKTYSVTEAAEVLGISKSLMYRVIRMDGFPVIDLGRRKRIPIKSLEKWMEEQAAIGWIC